MCLNVKRAKKPDIKGKELSGSSDRRNDKESGREGSEEGESSPIDYQRAIAVSASGGIRAESNQVEEHTPSLALFQKSLQPSYSFLSRFQSFLSLFWRYTNPQSIQTDWQPIVLSHNRVPLVPSPLTTNWSKSTDNQVCPSTDHGSSGRRWIQEVTDRRCSCCCCCRCCTSLWSWRVSPGSVWFQAWFLSLFTRWVFLLVEFFFYSLSFSSTRAKDGGRLVMSILCRTRTCISCSRFSLFLFWLSSRERERERGRKRHPHLECNVMNVVGTSVWFQSTISWFAIQERISVIPWLSASSPSFSMSRFSCSFLCVFFSCAFSFFLLRFFLSYEGRLILCLDSTDDKSKSLIGSLLFLLFLHPHPFLSLFCVSILFFLFFSYSVQYFFFYPIHPHFILLLSLQWLCNWFHVYDHFSFFLFLASLCFLFLSFFLSPSSRFTLKKCERERRVIERRNESQK